MKNIYVLFIVYILIIILEIIFTYNLSDIKSDSTIQEDLNIKFNLENEDLIKQKITEKLYELSDLINTGKMNFNEWSDYLKNDKNTNIKIGKYNYLLTSHQYVPGVQETVVLKTPKSNYMNNQDHNSLWSETSAQKISSYEVTGIINNNKNHPEVMIRLAKINKISSLSYNNIDSFSNENVIKNTLYTKWINKNGSETGILTYGYDILNLNDIHRFKYINLISKYELAITSILMFCLSITILYAKTNSYSLLKSIVFLIGIHIYILYYVNISEVYSNIDFELEKIRNINNSILGVSFLSGVSIFIMNFVYKHRKKLFIETSVFFSCAILLLLSAIYKSSDDNLLNEIIKTRITNQLIFNISIFLNAVIILNFLSFSFFK